MTLLRLGPLAHDGGDNRPVLMLTTDAVEPEQRGSLSDLVRVATDGGVDWVLVRCKGATRNELRETARLLYIHRAVTGCLIIVGGSAVAARESWANGVHLGEYVGAVKTAQRRGAGWVGRSLSLDHLDEVAWRVSEKPDYLVAENVFTSWLAHKQKERLLALRTFCTAAHVIPVLAAGNVWPENAADCLDAGAAGVVISALPLMEANDPRAIVEAYRAALDDWWEQSRGRVH